MLLVNTKIFALIFSIVCAFSAVKTVGAEESMPFSAFKTGYAVGTQTDGLWLGRLKWEPGSLATASSPGSLSYNPPSSATEVEYITLSDNPRQILAPTGLVDITTATDTLIIKFYDISDVGSLSGGVYLTTGDPFKTITYENISSTTVVVTTENASEVVTSEYELSENTGTGTYTRTDNLTGRKEVWINGTDGNGDRTKTYEVRDASQSNLLVSKRVDTYHEFDWGYELIKTQNDPAGANLTTTYVYDEDEQSETFKSLLSTSNPDGSWTYNDGTSTYRTWKDGALPGSGAPGDANSVKTTGGATYIAGTLVSNSETTEDEVTFESVTLTQSIREEWYGAGGGDSLITTTYSYPSDAATDYLRGKTYAVLYPDGRRTSYQYAEGTYNPSTGEFVTETDGPAFRTTRIEGTVSSPSGIANKTTKTETIVLDRDTVQENSYVYNGSGYTLMTTTKNSYSNHNLTEKNRDGIIVYEAVYTGGFVTSEKDEAGIETTFTYDESGRVETQTLEGSPDLVTTFTYDVEGRGLSETTVGGSLSRSTSRTYDVAGRLSSETDEMGRVAIYSYANGGRTVTATRPGGITEVTDHYYDGQIKSVTGSGVVSRYFTYGTDGVATQYTKERIKDDNDTRYTKKTVDGLGRVISIVMPKYGGGTREEAKVYNAGGQLSTETRTGLGDITYSYSDPYTTTRTVDADPDPDQVTSTSTTYAQIASHPHVDDGWYQVFTRTTGSGGDECSTVSKQQISGLGMEFIQLDGQSNETSSHTSVNRGTKTVTTTAKCVGVTTASATVSVNGLMTSNQDSAQPDDTTYAYDDLRRRITIDSPENGTVIYTYDDTPTSGYPKGVVDSITAEGETTGFTYFALNNAAAGLLDTQTDPAGKSKVHGYSNRGQLTSVSGTAAYKLGYTYDDYGQMTELKTYRAAAGSPDITTWGYENSTGLLTSKTDAASEAVTYTYTTGHLLDVRTWARSGAETTDYGYNNAGQVNSINYSAGTSDVFCTYDSVGRRVTAASSTMGAVTYTYDDNHMPLSEDYEGGPLDELVLTRTYANAKRSGLSIALNASSVFASQGYNYNSSTGRWDFITQGSARIDYGYVNGRNLFETLTHKWSANTVMTRTIGYSVDSARITNISHIVSQNNVNAHGTSVVPITYDSRGNRTGIKREDGSSWTYGYNDHSEVISGEKRFSDLTYIPGHRFSYTFDDIGNRTAASKGGSWTGSGLDAISYSINSLNQYSAVSNPGHLWVCGEADADSQAFVNGAWAWRKGTFLAKDVTPSNGSAPVNQPVTVTSKLLGAGTAGATLVQESAGTVLVPQASCIPDYDEDGNLTDDDLWTYTWDAENRLIQMVSDSDVPTAARRKLVFAYDWMSRRISKEVYTWNSSDYHATPAASLLFVYDAWSLIAELDALNNNEVVRSYIWGPDLSGRLQGGGGVGGLLAVNMATMPGSPTVFPCYAPNGNISALIRASDAAVVAQYEYGPFGELLRASGILGQANPMRFSSKYRDSENGLYYYGYRFYDSSAGRWLSRDPLDERGGANLYGFVKNSPLNRIDLLGLVEVKFGDKTEEFTEAEKGNFKKDFQKAFNIAAKKGPIAEKHIAEFKKSIKPGCPCGPMYLDIIATLTRMQETLKIIAGWDSESFTLHYDPRPDGMYARGYEGLQMALAYVKADGSHNREVWIVDKEGAGSVFLHELAHLAIGRPDTHDKITGFKELAEYATSGHAYDTGGGIGGKSFYITLIGDLQKIYEDAAEKKGFIKKCKVLEIMTRSEPPL